MLLLSGTLVTIAMIGGGVALALAGRDVGFIIGIVAPIAAAAGTLLAALSKLVSLERKTDEQTETLQQIEHQTNGALRATIEASIDRAFRRRFGPPSATLSAEPPWSPGTRHPYPRPAPTDVEGPRTEGGPDAGFSQP